ncbi:hypothetical protein N9T44_02230, partial [Candidatus Pelagibacter sp.]|nr:hypothetical protein [Candidatus Pelagibacter sp.]
MTNKVVSKKKFQIEETVYLCCSIKKILPYCYYAGYVFNIKELIFCEDFKNLDQENITIILHQNKINEFLNFKFKTKSKKIYIILADGYIDYLQHKEKITVLNKIGYEVTIISYEEEDWFDYDGLNHYSCNRSIISQKNTLKKIYGANFRTKLKYYFPLIQSTYNALVNIKFSLPFLIKPKVVYVGRATQSESLQTLDFFLNTGVITKYLYNKILKDLNQKNQKNLFELIDDYEFKNLNFAFQYFIYNIIIRLLIISHLNQFKNFYHKSNKLFNFELLRTNIFKKIFHIDLGVKPGNSFVCDRTIYLERF